MSQDTTPLSLSILSNCVHAYYTYAVPAHQHLDFLMVVSSVVSRAALAMLDATVSMSGPLSAVKNVPQLAKDVFRIIAHHRLQ
jgi:hypothetical protein